MLMIVLKIILKTIPKYKLELARQRKEEIGVLYTNILLGMGN